MIARAAATIRARCRRTGPRRCRRTYAAPRP